MRKSNVCLCTLVVRQLLGGGRGGLKGCWRAVGEVTGDAGSPAPLLDPLLLPWATSGACPSISLSCQPSRKPPHLPLPTGLPPQKGQNRLWEEAALAREGG